MRFVILLALLAAPAFAETRVGVHIGGGLEAGFIQGKPRPDAVMEAGIGLDHYFGNWGVGIVLESVGRYSEPAIPIAEELKLDVLARFAFRPTRPGLPKRGSLSFGAGVRYITVAATDRRPASSVQGFDLLRIENEIEIWRYDRFALDFYFAWTFGFYNDVYLGERSGDMPYPKVDVETIANSYVLGLKTSFAP